MAVVPRQMSSGTKWSLLSHSSENQEVDIFKANLNGPEVAA